MTAIRSMFATGLASGLFALSALSGCGPAEDVEPLAPARAVGVACPERGPLSAPSMPASIAPPADAELFYRVYAEGTQIYTCGMGATGTGWTLKAPDAKLYDDRCVEVGTHFGGPTWQITADGSAVVGKKTAEAPATQAGAIPWLLLGKNTTSGNGLFTGVTHVSRIDTVGGVAPSTGCDASTLGAETVVPYTATYLYYRAKSAPQQTATAGSYGY